MSYDVTVNGRTTNVSSYEAAKNAVKDGLYAEADRLATPVSARLYRSPKTVARVNADRLNSSIKVGSGQVKLPKTAGDVSGRVGGVAFAITRK